MSTWGFEALDDWEGDFGEAVEEPDGSQMRESHHDGK